jgi:AcrR family transcriptional regulator
MVPSAFVGLSSHEHYGTIMDMSIPYEATGRTNQKSRTKAALVDAARSLVASGRMPTVEEAAAHADISRTTAYRYFRNQRELLGAAYPTIDRVSLLGDDPPDDVGERLDIVLDAHLRTIVENEPAMRAALRLGLEPRTDDEEGPILRRGRAIGWFKDALEPLALPEGELQRLAVAIRAAAGIEPLVWLVDIAGLSRDEAVTTMKRTARAILRDALDRQRS